MSNAYGLKYTDLTMPSREFLVRQACLNAVPKCWPASTKYSGVAKTLKDMGCDGAWVFTEVQLLSHILREFRNLVLKFDSAEVSYCK